VDVGYRLGVEVGSESTVWAIASVEQGGRRLLHVGRVPTVVAPGADRLVAGAEVATAAPGAVSGFGGRVGDTEPIMVAGVPYGVESLVGAVLASVGRTAVAAGGAVPGFDYVVIAHADGLDAYRVGLWREAARVAGVPVASTATVDAAFARATLEAHGASVGVGDEVAAGAALARVSSDTDPMPAAGVGVAEVVAGAGAAGVVAGGALLWTGSAGAGGAIASAAAPLVGPAGVPLSAAGPAGTPLSAPGPAGAPLAPAGPAGTPLPPAGPAGTPLPPAGPAGTPLTATGPAGTPLAPVDVSATTAKTSKGLGKLFAGSKGAVIVGTIAVVAVGTVAVVVATHKSPSKQSVAPAPSTTVSAVSTTTGPIRTVTTVAVATSVPTSTTSVTATGATFDVTPMLGSWIDCEPYLAGDGASSGTWTLTSPGPGLIDMLDQGFDYKNTTCSGASPAQISGTVHFKVTGTVSAGGVTGFTVEMAAKPECTDVMGGQACAISIGSMSANYQMIGVDGAGLLRWGSPPSTWAPVLKGMAKK
jgi:hypothetical protein